MAGLSTRWAPDSGRVSADTGGDANPPETLGPYLARALLSFFTMVKPALGNLVLSAIAATLLLVPSGAHAMGSHRPKAVTKKKATPAPAPVPTSAPAPAPVLSQGVPRDRAGIVIHQLEDGEVAKSRRLSQLGAGWARIDLPWMRIDWSTREESLGIEVDPWASTYNPARIYDFDRAGVEATVRNLENLGIQALGSFNYVPYGHQAEVYGGQGCDAERCPSWERMVEATVRHFGKRIYAYGIFNEPNDPNQFPSYDHYVDMLITGCRVIHRVGAEIGQPLKCAGPELGASPSAEQDRDLILQALQRARLKGVEVDLVTTHTYGDGPDSQLRLSVIRAGMRANGFNQPVWLAETGLWNRLSEVARFQGGLDKALESQERDIVDKYRLAAQGVADKVFSYELDEADAADSFYGITTSDSCKSPRPAFNALRRLIQGQYQSCATGLCTGADGKCSKAACTVALGSGC